MQTSCNVDSSIIIPVNEDESCPPIIVATDTTKKHDCCTSTALHPSPNAASCPPFTVLSGTAGRPLYPASHSATCPPVTVLTEGRNNRSLCLPHSTFPVTERCPLPATHRARWHRRSAVDAHAHVPARPLTNRHHQGAPQRIVQPRARGCAAATPPAVPAASALAPIAAAAIRIGGVGRVGGVARRSPCSGARHGHACGGQHQGGVGGLGHGQQQGRCKRRGCRGQAEEGTPVRSGTFRKQA